MACGAGRATFIPRQEHFVLQAVVLLGLQFMEEIIQPSEIFVSGPNQVFLFLRQGIERRVNRESELRGIHHQRILPFFHLLALPARDSLFVNRLRLVGND